MMHCKKFNTEIRVKSGFFLPFPPSTPFHSTHYLRPLSQYNCCVVYPSGTKSTHLQPLSCILLYTDCIFHPKWEDMFMYVQEPAFFTYQSLFHVEGCVCVHIHRNAAKCSIPLMFHDLRKNSLFQGPIHCYSCSILNNN